MPWCKWCPASVCCVSMRPSNLATPATCERGSRGRNCASPWIAAACPSSLKDGVTRPVASLLIAVDRLFPYNMSYQPTSLLIRSQKLSVIIQSLPERCCRTLHYSQRAITTRTLQTTLVMFGVYRRSTQVYRRCLS